MSKIYSQSIHNGPTKHVCCQTLIMTVAKENNENEEFKRYMFREWRDDDGGGDGGGRRCGRSVSSRVGIVD